MAAVPVTLLTGFLGSGKTTLLRRLLSDPGMTDTAVLINEFGEIGLDHLLVSRVEGTTAVLQNGCVCCTLRSDLRQGVIDLLNGPSARSSSSFRRIVIETTGLADPVPIVDMLVHDEALRNRVQFAHTVTTVDAVHGAAQLDGHVESLRQAAMADRLVITKGDVAGKKGVAQLRKRLKAVNPTARLFDAQAADFAPAALIEGGLADPATKLAEVKHWIEAGDGHGDHDHDIDAPHDHADHAHSPRIHTFSIRVTAPIEWPALAMWLASLVRRYGPKILRIKGLLNIAGAPGPIVLHGIQHVIHPPIPLDAWPDADTSSRIVFVIQDIDPRPIHQSLLAFLARRSAPAGGSSV